MTDLANDPNKESTNPEADFFDEAASSQDESPEDSRIFRRASIERLGIHDQLDKLFIPINVPYWIVWLTIFAISAAFIVWLFLGSIPIMFDGTGIVMNREGLFTIQSKTTGFVENVFVKAGDQVAKDQLIAKIDNPQVDLKYEASKKKIQILKQELTNSEQRLQKKSENENQSLEKQITENESFIHLLEMSIQTLIQEVKNKERLLKEGLDKAQDYKELKQILFERQRALESAKEVNASLMANLFTPMEEANLQEKKRDLYEAEKENELLKLSKHYNNIYSPSSGRIIEILVDKGNKVEPGSPILHLEYSVEGISKHIFYAFVPIEMGKKIQKGTRVEIELSTVRAEEYGSIVGYVTEISHYAVSKESIGNMIQNEGLINFLTRGANTVVQVTVEPVLDPSTPTGYKWTSGKGPSIMISTGTICTVRGIVDREKPIFYFFSPWKFW